MTSTLYPKLIIRPLRNVTTVQTLVSIKFPVSLTLTHATTNLSRVTMTPTNRFYSISLVRQLLVKVTTTLSRRERLYGPLQFRSLNVRPRSILRKRRRLLPTTTVSQTIMKRANVFLPMTLLHLPRRLFRLALLLLNDNLFFFLYRQFSHLSIFSGTYTTSGITEFRFLRKSVPTTTNVYYVKATNHGATTKDQIREAYRFTTRSLNKGLFNLRTKSKRDVRRALNVKIRQVLRRVLNLNVFRALTRVRSRSLITSILSRTRVINSGSVNRFFLVLRVRRRVRSLYLGKGIRYESQLITSSRLQIRNRYTTGTSTLTTTTVRLITRALYVALVRTSNLRSLNSTNVMFIAIFTNFVSLRQFSSRFLRTLTKVRQAKQVLRSRLRPNASKLSFLNIRFNSINTIMSSLAVNGVVRPRRRTTRHKLTTTKLTRRTRYNTTLSFRIRTIRHVRLTIYTSFRMFFRILYLSRGLFFRYRFLPTRILSYNKSGQRRQVG